MLRNALIGIGALCAAIGLGLIGAGEPGGIGALIFGSLLLAGTLFERVVYKRVSPQPPGPSFQRTAECFVDPESGKTITVWIDPATGDRAYVEN